MFSHSSITDNTVGNIVPTSEFNQTTVYHFILNQNNEKIYFTIKSDSNEYCFTNLAFIHLGGQNSSNPKQILTRYPYRYCAIDNIQLEIDNIANSNISLKFTLNKNEHFSILMDIKEIEKIRNIYKVLLTINEQYQIIRSHEWVLEKSFSSTMELIDLQSLPEKAIMALPKILNHTISQLESAYNQRLQEIRQYDFSAIFEQYLNS